MQATEESADEKDNDLFLSCTPALMKFYSIDYELKSGWQTHKPWI